MTVAPKHKKMTVPEFFEWAAGEPRGRYELVDGEIVAKAPERLRHNLVKMAVHRALRDAVKAAGLPCTVFGDGVGAVIDQFHSRLPDASVQCGVQVDLDSMVLQAPVIVVEAVSPSSERDDTGDKLVEYFSVPGIRHYLIVHPGKAAVIHHARNGGGVIETRIAKDGELDLTPPGFAVAVRDLLDET